MLKKYRSGKPDLYFDTRTERKRFSPELLLFLLLRFLSA